MVNGIGKASEKPNIPTIGFRKTPCEAAIKIDPAKGPVQENDTKTSVKAMKNTPNKPPLSDLASTELTKPEGKTISKAPKKEIAKTAIIIK